MAFDDGFLSSGTNNFVSSVASGVSQAAKDVVLAFNEDGMKVAANYINQAYTTLAQNIEEINKMFDDYIGPAGEAIKTPAFAVNTNEAWHDDADVGLQDFMNNYSEWSDVIALVNATAASYAEDTKATYAADDVKIEEGADATKMQEILDGLDPLVTYQSRKKVNELLNSNISYDNLSSVQQYETAKSGLSESELQLLQQKNQATANQWYRSFVDYKNGDSSDTVNSCIEKQNPDVIRMMEQRYKEEVSMVK